jgi:hypothetical protein
MTKGGLMTTMEMQVNVIKPKTLVNIGTFVTIPFFWFLKKCSHGYRSHGFHSPSGDLKNIYYLKEVAFIWVQSQSNERKMHWTTKKNSQNRINIYVLPFKAMVIMASYCFFIHMNVKELK